MIIRVMQIPETDEEKEYYDHITFEKEFPEGEARAGAVAKLFYNFMVAQGFHKDTINKFIIEEFS